MTAPPDQRPDRSSPQRRSVRLRLLDALPLAQMLIGAIVLGVFLWRVDVLGALRNLPSLELRWAIAGTVTFTLSKVVHAYRWRFFLRHRPEIPFHHLLQVFLVSNLANAVIPLRAGDLLRVELPSRRYGVPRAELASSVFLVESLLDGVAFVLLAFGSLLIFDLPLELRPAVGTLAIVVLLVSLVSVRAARSGQRWSFLDSRWRRLAPGRAHATIDGWLTGWVTGMRTLSDWRSGTVAVALSLVAWLLEVEVWWLMGRAFGIELAFSEALVVMIAANMAQAIPITPWNIGPYEVAVTEILALLGFTRLDASSYAIGSRLLLIVWIGLTGLLAMWTLRLRPRDLLGYRPAATLDPSSDDKHHDPAAAGPGAPTPPVAKLPTQHPSTEHAPPPPPASGSATTLPPDGNPPDSLPPERSSPTTQPANGSAPTTPSPDGGSPTTPSPDGSAPTTPSPDGGSPTTPPPGAGSPQPSLPPGTGSPTTLPPDSSAPARKPPPRPRAGGAPPPDHASSDTPTLDGGTPSDTPTPLELDR